MSPLRIIEYISLLVVVVWLGYLTYVGWLYWSGAGSIIILLIVIVLLFMEDRKQ